MQVHIEYARAGLPMPDLTPTPVLREIRVIGRLLADLEQARVKYEQRIYSATKVAELEMPPLDALHAGAKAIEHDAGLQLRRLWRRHPLYEWALEQPGIGDGLVLPRLLAETGDPAIRPVGHFEEDDYVEDGEPKKRRRFVVDEYVPRTAAQFRQFCGVGAPGRIPAGATQAQVLARGNPYARMLLFRLAVSLERATGGARGAVAWTRRSPYRDVYEGRRGATVDRAGEDGKPWTPGHSRDDALRIVGKTVALDLWREDARLRGMPTTAKRGRRGGRKHRWAGIS